MLTWQKELWGVPAPEREGIYPRELNEAFAASMKFWGLASQWWGRGKLGTQEPPLVEHEFLEAQNTASVKREVGIRGSG